MLCIKSEPYTPIALPTAITFLVACVAVLLLSPDQGWMAIITSESGAGVLGRRLLPAAVIVPIVLGWLRLLAEAGNLYEDAVRGGGGRGCQCRHLQALVAWSVLAAAPDGPWPREGGS